MSDDNQTEYPTIFSCFTMNHVFEFTERLCETNSEMFNFYDKESLEYCSEILNECEHIYEGLPNYLGTFNHITKDTRLQLYREIRRIHIDWWGYVDHIVDPREDTFWDEIIGEAFHWYVTLSEGDPLFDAFVQIKKDEVMEIVEMEREDGDREWADAFVKEHFD